MLLLFLLGMEYLRNNIPDVPGLDPDAPGLEDLLNYFDGTYVTGTFRRIQPYILVVRSASS